MARLQQLEHFVEQAALRHIGQQRQTLLQRAGRRLVQLEFELVQLGGKTHGADDAHRVLAVTRSRIANHADGAFLRILHTLVVVDHDLALGVVIHGVEREIAPRRILFLRAPDVVAQHATAGIHRMLHALERAPAGLLVAVHLLGCRSIQIGAEGRHLDHLMLAPAPVHHVHDAEPAPDDEGATEQALHLLGRGRGGHIEILGLESQNQVTHRAADDIGLETRLLEREHHVDGTLVHQLGIDLVHRGRQLDAFAERRTHACCRLAQQFVDEALDHVIPSETGRECASRALAPARAGVRPGWWPPAPPIFPSAVHHCRSPSRK